MLRVLGRFGGDRHRRIVRRLVGGAARQPQVRADLARFLGDDQRQHRSRSEQACHRGKHPRANGRRVRRHLAAMFVKQRAPPLDMFVFDSREVVEDRAPRRIRLDARERAIQPRGVHLVAVVITPGGFDRHIRPAARR